MTAPDRVPSVLIPVDFNETNAAGQIKAHPPATAVEVGQRVTIYDKYEDMGCEATVVAVDERRVLLEPIPGTSRLSRQVHEVRGEFVISENHVWVPGCYESREAAIAAFNHDDADLQALQDAANLAAGGTGGVITMADLQREPAVPPTAGQVERRTILADSRDGDFLLQEGADGRLACALCHHPLTVENFQWTAAELWPDSRVLTHTDCNRAAS